MPRVVGREADRSGDQGDVVRQRCGQVLDVHADGGRLQRGDESADVGTVRPDGEVGEVVAHAGPRRQALLLEAARGGAGGGVTGQPEDLQHPRNVDSPDERTRTAR